jgi:hypothetical protein
MRLILMLALLLGFLVIALLSILKIKREALRPPPRSGHRSVDPPFDDREPRRSALGERE